MELSKLIVHNKTVWAEYPGFPGFEVELAYITKDELIKIRKKAITNKISRKTRQVEEEVDTELFQSMYIQAVIKGWKGLKYTYLNKMVPVDLSAIPKDEEELAFSHNNAEVLMKNVSGFDAWVTDQLEDVELFTKNS